MTHLLGKVEAEEAKMDDIVSVIVPCRDESATIEKCVRSILTQDGLARGDEIIFADGLSEDGTVEILGRVAKLDPRVKVISNRGQIVSTGLNAAIGSSRGNIIIRLDAHTEYASDYISRCRRALQETGADNVGGPARTKANTYVGKAIAAAYHSPFAVGGAKFHNVTYEGWADTVTYGCWHRSAFERFGYFDEELVRNQDDEHNLRITRGGGRIWQSPKIRSWYRPRGSLNALFRQYTQYGYWKVRVIQKHKLPASWRHLVPGAFVLALMLLFLLSAICFPWPVKSFAHYTGQLSAFSLLLLCSIYLLGVSIASVLTASKTEWKLLPVLPAVFCCYHFGYGWGFLRGVVDFMLLKRQAASAFKRLTRQPET